jgi:hypothetical protein
MSVNKYLPHVLIIPEDHADEQIANGFTKHDQVSLKQVQVMPCADGWPGVLSKFETQYIHYLRNNHKGYVILLIDFDNKYTSQRDRFGRATPDDLKDRVFVVGVRETPEALRQAVGKGLEAIGWELADNCYQGVEGLWADDHLKHNDPDRIKLVDAVKSILFPATGGGASVG